jgi:GTP pyrophosphokinase
VYHKLLAAGIQDQKVLASALLHHLPNILPQATATIAQEVDPEVARLVALYHNLATKVIKRESPKHYNHKYVVQTYMSLAEDMRVLAIILANQCHNIETAYTLPHDQRRAVAEETLFIYAPIAKMLTIGSFTRTLEDEAFKIINPAQYSQVKALIDTVAPRLNSFFAQAIPVVKEFLVDKGIETELSYRIKAVYSTYKKLGKYKAHPVGGKTIHGDIGAMRIVTQSVEAVYLVEDILKSLWTDIPTLRDDYIQKPRVSGYQSLHNTFEVEPGLYVEVQIRTQAMHQEAEYGLCSHLFYKVGDTFKKELATNPHWVKDLNYFEAYHSAKTDAPLTNFAGTVYAFTPKGDIVALPRNATALDFAYYVHSDVGTMCAGAKINGAMAKIDTLVQDGDVVEILVDKNKHQPSKDWLQLVGTKKARWEILKGLRV